MLVLIGVLIFTTVALVAFELLRPRSDIVGQRIGVTPQQDVSTASHRVSGGFRQRILAPAVNRAGGLASRLLPQNWVRGIDRMLVMANEPWSLAGFLSAWLLALGLGILSGLYIRSSNGSPGVLGLVAIVVIAFAAILPYARLRNLVKKRQKAIVRALPDAMDLLTTSVEAGLGIDAAFALVVEKTDGPLSETFALYLRQVGLGRGRQDALVYVALRTGVPDLIRIANNVNQGEELGTPLGDVLRRQAEDLRLTRRQRAQEAAQRAPVLMTIPMATCFLPAMGAVIMVPSIMNLIRFVGTLGE